MENTKYVERLARLWCQYCGQKGTPKQVAKMLRTVSAESLERMLAERGATIDRETGAITFTRMPRN